MKKILYFLGSRSLWVMLGIAGLIILVWFIGPLIFIGEISLLASKAIRLTQGVATGMARKKAKGRCGC